MTRYKTDANEFKKFADLLISGCDNYIPWFFPLVSGNKDPLNNQGWKAIREEKATDNRPRDKYRIDTVQAARYLKDHGNNIGIAGTEMDKLVIIDVDDEHAFRDHEFVPTLTTRSSSRVGVHHYYFTDDIRCKVNIPLDDIGELRTYWQYVVAPGSFAKIADSVDSNGMITKTGNERTLEIPEDDRENAGKYTIENAIKPAWITFDDIPDVFKAAAKKREQQDNEHKNHPLSRPHIEHGSTHVQSAFFDLEISDIIGVHNEGKRFHSPVHDSHTGMNTSVSKGLMHCWRHGVSHNAFTLLAVMAGLYNCVDAGTGHRNAGAGSSCVDYTDCETVFKVWQYARGQGYIPNNDPIPSRALVFYAISRGVCSEPDIIDGWKIPSDMYISVINALKKENITVRKVNDYAECTESERLFRILKKRHPRESNDPAEVAQ